MILVCGEALVDLLPATCDGAAGYVPRLGGSPANVAVGLARLDVPTSWFGRLSTDRFGRRLRERFRSEGVDVRWALDGPQPTPLALVDVDADGHPSYAFWWAGTADRAIGAEDVPGDLAGVDAVHVGSVALVLPPACDAYAALARREAGRRVVSMDPNVRWDLVDDPAAYRARLHELVAHADVVKVSDEDLSALEPGADPIAVARRWAAGGRVVVLTRGGEGALGIADAGSVEVAARRVAVVDTVGAGDAFVAGLLARLREQGNLDSTALASLDLQALEDALRFAGEVAARTCERAGADAPRRSELPA